MSDGSIHIDLNDSIFEEIRKLRADFGKISGTVAEMEKKTNASLGGIGKQLKAINLVSVYQGFQNVSQELTNLSKPGLEFGASLSELSALTGTSGKDLDELAGKARSSAKEFGGSASASLDTYKTILGRLGPGIAQNKVALGDMERNVQILSKTMGGDAAGAVDALTTGMLQFGVDLSNPKTAAAEMAKMMDVMANAAQEGAAEVPSISAALKVSGVAAKQAKVSFIETNAAIQALATGGKEGSEAGMALRNVLGKMAGEDVIPKEAAAKLKALGVNMDIVSNTSLPFTTRLRELKKAQGDATVMAQVFGVENAAGASILLDSVDAQDQLAKVIAKTGGAQEQANVVMESSAEKMKRQQAYIEDLKLSFFDATGGATAFLGPVAEIGQTMTGLSPIFSTVKSGLGFLKQQFDGSKGSAKGLSEGIDGIGKSAGKSKGLMGGLGSAMKGIGWAAVAAGAIALAAAIYDVASGANEARLNMEAFQKGSAKGQKIGEKITSGVTSKRDAEIEKARNLQLAGEIDEKEFKRREIEARKKAKAEIREEISVKNIDKSFRDRDVKKHQKRQKEDDQKFFSTEEDRQLFGMKSIASDLADAKGDRARVNKSLTVLNSAFSENDQELARAEAELKGMDNKKAEPKSNPIKPSGYSSTDKEKDYQGTGGEMKNINIRIDNLVKDLTISTTNLTESAGQVKQIITEALVAAVRNTEVAL